MMTGTKLSTKLVYQSQWHTFSEHGKQIDSSISGARKDTLNLSVALL